MRRQCVIEFFAVGNLEKGAADIIVKEDRTFTVSLPTREWFRTYVVKGFVNDDLVFVGNEVHPKGNVELRMAKIASDEYIGEWIEKYPDGRVWYSLFKLTVIDADEE